jgi:hypothetical protein
MSKPKEFGLSISYGYFENKRNCSLIAKIIKFSYFMISELMQLVFADYVYIPAMILGNRRLRIYFNISRFLRKKIIYEFYISLYDTEVNDRKYISSSSKRARLLAKLDSLGNQCHRSIYLNPCEARRYRNLSGLPFDSPNKVIIPLNVLQRRFGNLPFYNSVSKTFNMVWWGTYIPLHGLDKIIQATHILSDKYDIHLYICGNNPELSKRYEQQIDSIPGLNRNVTIYNDLTFTNGELEDFIVNKCDLAFGCFGDSDKAKTVILNKAIEAIGMKIPILTQNSEAFDEYFSQDMISYCENTPEKMAEAIEALINSNLHCVKTRTEMAYQVYMKYFSREASIKMYQNMLENL